MSAGVDRNRARVDRNTSPRGGGGALERNQGAPLEPLAKLGDALHFIGTLDTATTICVEAAEMVLGQAASTGMGSVSTGADKKRTLGEDRGESGALELLEHAVPLDAARDDDGGGNAEPLVGEVDLLGRLSALELVDLKCVAVDTAKGRGTLSVGADRKANTRESVRATGGVL